MPVVTEAQLESVLKKYKAKWLSFDQAKTELWDLCTSDHSLPNLKTERYFAFVDKLNELQRSEGRAVENNLNLIG